MSRFLTACSLVVIASCVWAGEFVPFVIPDRLAVDSPLRPPVSAIGKSEAFRIVARDGHFYRGEERVRIWGVNTSFEANLPAYDDAANVADRLASLGVNNVRLHHMDTSAFPRGVWDRENPGKLHPEALRLLDHYVAELAKRGITVNLNLHVGHEFSEDLGLEKAPRKYDKITSIFTREIIDAHKDFAREMLTRVNPERGLRYADDPAVAFVEITNENSLFMWSAEETLATLPAFYAERLDGLFADWLKRKYGTTVRLRAAWSEDTQPLGTNLLKNGQLAAAPGQAPNDWRVERHQGAAVDIAPATWGGAEGLRFDIQDVGNASWHLQLNQPVAVKAGQYYTVSFRAVAPAGARSFTIGVGMAHEPWQNLGLSRSARLTNEWQTYSFGFVAAADDDNARLNLSYANSDEPFLLADISLGEGGQMILLPGESLESGRIATTPASASKRRGYDREQFLMETEKAYFDEMYAFIKNDLHGKALVTGTIAFGPLALYAQSDMDFIDTHAYWHHPHFPGRPWDLNNWIVRQTALTDHPESGLLQDLALSRVAGKPLTVTEYNHPAPNDFQAEAVPLLASYGNSQDWDGVWLYSYKHDGKPSEHERFTSFFDIHANPGKLGFMPAGAAIFSRDRGQSSVSAALPLPTGQHRLELLADLQRKHERGFLAAAEETAGIGWEGFLGNRHHWDFRAAPTILLQPSRSAFVPEWKVFDGKGVYLDRAGSVVTGHASSIAKLSGGFAEITSPAFAVVTLTGLDDPDPARADRLLLTACGRCENEDMGFNADRTTLGTRWGSAPVRIETVEATITLPPGRWTCRALKPDGSPGKTLPVDQSGTHPTLQIGPEAATMWYLLEKTR